MLGRLHRFLNGGYILGESHIVVENGGYILGGRGKFW